MKGVGERTKKTLCVAAVASLGLVGLCGCGKKETVEEIGPEVAEAIRAVDTDRSLTKDQEEEIGAIVRAYAGEDHEAILAGRDRLQEMERDALPSLIRRAVSEPDASLRRAAFVGVSRIASGARITQGRGADWVDGLRPFWRRMSRDPDPGIRAQAVRELVAFHGHDAVKEVAEILRRDPARGVQYKAADLLIRLGREDLVPPELAKSIKESEAHADYGYLVIPREGFPSAKVPPPEE